MEESVDIHQNYKEKERKDHYGVWSGLVLFGI